jgi:hypothetical protein
LTIEVGAAFVALPVVLATVRAAHVGAPLTVRVRAALVAVTDERAVRAALPAFGAGHVLVVALPADAIDQLAGARVAAVARTVAFGAPARATAEIGIANFVVTAKRVVRGIATDA